jgi:hypothetical protein
MNTKILMSANAILMGVTGIAMSFAPDEMLSVIGVQEPVAMEKLLVQLAGAMYFGFAMINWMARGNLIGGIYSRPVAVGNFTHFIVGALALSKMYFRAQDNFLLGITVVYVIFALLFGIVLFRHPVKE